MFHAIAFITANPELYEVAKAAIHKHTLPVSLIFGEMDNEIATVHAAITKGAKAFIGRGQLVTTFPASLGVPIVRVDVSPFDVMRALAGLKHTGGPVGVLGFKGFLSGCEEIGRFINMELRHREIASVDEALSTLQSFADEGVNYVVGNFGLIQKARLFGLAGVAIRSGEEAILKAVKEASNILALQSAWLENTEVLRGAVNTAQEGIIAIDKEERIVLVNPVAESLLSVEKTDVLGAPSEAIIPQLGLRDVLYADHPGPVVRVEIKGHTLLCRRVPVRHDKKNIGAVVCFQDISAVRRMERLARDTLEGKGLTASARIEDIVGSSLCMQKLRKAAHSYAQSDASVLIMGETGTGKELMAQGLHNASRRVKGPFVAVNCAALPESLLESELFGYEEGAFTGARRGGKAGLFELASGGTLFLDEIGEMPFGIQARLLRVLQERALIRLGGQKIIHVDVRIVAATNKSLTSHVAAGAFRNDLYYRLNALPIIMPSLRQRREDIPALAQVLLRKLSRQHQRNLVLDPDSLAMLQNASWPGNVRELEHFLERLLILSDDGQLSQVALKTHFSYLEYSRKWDEEDAASQPKRVESTAPLHEYSMHHIQAVLQAEGGNLSRAAAQLGIARSTLWRKLRSADSRSGKSN